MDSATKTISSFFALSAFAVAIVVGILAHNSPATVLSNALICMILCRIAGAFVGVIALRVVNAERQAYRAAHPIPDVNATLAMSADSGVAQPQPPADSTNSSQST